MSEEFSKKQMMQNFLNRKRKIDLKVEDGPQKPSTSSGKEANDDSEEKGKNEDQTFEKAKKALLFDAKRAKERADQVGPQGYLKPKSLGTNKEFLRRTIESTLSRRKK